MADFDTAWAALERDEGGYSNNPADPGGETYEGISRRYWPTWPGWQWVDKLKPDAKALRDNMALEELVKKFYRDNFWSFDGVHNQLLANKLLSEEVNLGKGNGVKCLQHALSYLNAGPFVVDGKWGPQTESMANEDADMQPDKLLAEFRAQIAYRYAVQAGASSGFLLGWLRRATE